MNGMNKELDKQLADIGHRYKFGSLTHILLEHQQVVADFGAQPEIAADYLDYKCRAVQSNHTPLGFLLWYVDIYKPNVDPMVYHHRAQENKLKRYSQGGCEFGKKPNSFQ